MAFAEKEVRLELLFLCNALVAILGVVATVNGTTAVSASGDVDWFASLALLLLMLLGGLAGYVFRHLYRSMCSSKLTERYIKQKKMKKN